MLYDAKSIHLIKQNLESGTNEGITYALELLDVLLAEDVKQALERLCHGDLLVQLPAAHPTDDQGPPATKTEDKLDPKFESYTKKPWSDIGNDSVKVAFLVSLNLSRRISLKVALASWL